jgi:hypothetical protein
LRKYVMSTNESTGGSKHEHHAPLSKHASIEKGNFHHVTRRPLCLFKILKIAILSTNLG